MRLPGLPRVRAVFSAPTPPHPQPHPPARPPARQVFLLVSTFPLSLIAIAYLVPETPFTGDAGRCCAWRPPV